MAAFTITDEIMRGDQAPHTATHAGTAGRSPGYPGRVLTRDQAVTAMMFAQLAGGLRRRLARRPGLAARPLLGRRVRPVRA